MTTSLQSQEITLLQKFYDEEVTPDERTRAEALLESSTSARVLISALEELTIAAKAAMDAACEGAEFPAPEAVLEEATRAADMATLPLEELAPLLERFHDGEVVEAEYAIVDAIMTEREDVVAYLASLEELAAGVHAANEQAVDSVDFADFFTSISDKIDAVTCDYDPEEHRVVLYRYHDQEASKGERHQVRCWLEEGVEEVVTTLKALEEISTAARAAAQQIEIGFDETALWHRVEEALDREVESAGENVVSIARVRRESVAQRYRQAIWGAVATAAAITIIFGAFGSDFFGPKEVLIKERTIVIVDSVEYSPGSSVMINSPMQPAAFVPGEEEDETPTVIWILDSDTQGQHEADEKNFGQPL